MKKIERRHYKPYIIVLSLKKKETIQRNGHMVHFDGKDKSLSFKATAMTLFKV
jgi:hypothetical protein